MLVLLFTFFTQFVNFSPVEQVQAQDTYNFIIGKQEAKKSTRWSLADWLEQRDRMRLMDLWLALHSPTPYEFYFGGHYQMGEHVSAGRYTGMQFHLGAYATIFGLEMQYERAHTPNWHGLFNLRIFGYQDQGTNITLHAGIRSQADGSNYRNPLAGASLTFYFTRFFGIKVLWRKYFDSSPGASDEIVNGSRAEAGGFLDFSFLRIFGCYFSQPETTTIAGTPTDSSRTGVALGTMIYF